MIKQLQFLFLLIILIGLSACDLPERSRFVHEKSFDRETRSIDPLADDDPFPVTESALKRTDNNPEDQLAVLNQIMSNPESYIRHSKTNFEDIRLATHNFYEALLKANKATQAKELQTFETLLLFDCGGKNLNCDSLKGLKSSFLFPEVIELWLGTQPESLQGASEEEILKIYTVLHLYFEGKQRPSNAAIEEYYLRNIKSIKNLMKCNDCYYAGLSQQSFNDLLFEIFQQYSSHSGERQLQKIVSDLAAFNLKPKDQVTKFDSNLFKSAIQTSMYIEESLNPVLKGTIEELLDRPGNIRSKIGYLKKEVPLIFKSLDLKSEIQADEYVWIIDSVFNNRYESELTQLIWTQSKKDTSKYSQQLYDYLKIQLAYLIIWTNSEIKTVYERQDLTNYRFFIDTAAKGEQLTPKWRRFIGLVEQLNGFTEAHIGKFDESQDGNHFFGLFNYLKRNIKFLVVYPHMLLTAYHASIRDFVQEFRFFGKYYEVNSKTIAQEIFKGERNKDMPIFYDYGTHSDAASQHTERITFYELSYAYDFALRTMAFDSFNVKPEAFLNEIYQRVIDPQVNLLMNFWESSVNKHFRNPLYPEFRSFCRTLKGEDSYQAEVDLYMFNTAMTYGSLHDVIFATTNGNKTSGKETTIRVGLAPYETKVAEEIEAIKLVILRNLNLMDSLIHSTIEFNKTMLGQDEATARASLSQVLGRHQTARTKIREYLNAVIEVHKNYANCALEATIYEHRTVKEVLKLEVEHLKKVHRTMKAIRQGQDPDRSYLKFSGMPNGYTGFDRIDRDYYLYHNLDFLLRQRAHLATVSPRSRVQIPNDFADAPGIQTIYTNQTNIRIGYIEDEKEFLKAAFQGVLKFSKWYQADKLSSPLLWLKYMYPVVHGLDRISRIINNGQALDESVHHDSIVQMATRTLELLKLDQTDYELLELADRNHKFNIGDYSPFEDTYIYWKSKEAESFFNYVVYSASQERLGWPYKVPSNGRTVETTGNLIPVPLDSAEHPTIYEDALEYYEARKVEKRQQFIFPVSAYIDQNLDQVIHSNLEHEIKSFTDIFDSVKREICKDQDREASDPNKLSLEIYVGEVSYDNYLNFNRWPGLYKRRQKSFNRKSHDYFAGHNTLVDISKEGFCE